MSSNRILEQENLKGRQDIPPSNSVQFKKIVRVVFVALLLDLLAFTIILPLFPRLLEDYRERESGDETTLLSWSLRKIKFFKEFIETVSADDTGGYRKNPNSNPKWDIVLLGGALGSLYSLLQFVASPIIGAFSDRYGRRATLLVTMIGNILSTFLWLFAKSFSWFVWARVVGGLSEGNVQMSIAIMSDVTTRETRSKGLALVGIAFAISFTIGPALGAYFASKNLAALFPLLVKWGLSPYSAPAFVALILLSIETLYLYIALPETANLQMSEDTIKFLEKPLLEKDFTENGIDKTLANPISRLQRFQNLQILNFVHFLYLFFFAGMEFTLTFLTFDLFDFSNMQNGKLLGYIGILSALIQGGYIHRYGHKIGEKKLVGQGVASCAIALAIFATLKPTANDIIWLYIGATLLAITSATVVNCLTSLATMQCDENDDQEHTSSNSNISSFTLSKGQALGTFRSFGQLGRAVGPMAACSLYWISGSEKCYGAGSLAMFFIFAIIILKVPDAHGKKMKKA
ncbi:hypothetical protein G9A89_019416 [Geosiphon pyriformis]|nr:hypothetical protein G9A89_019416 [Geosiphon pyriformis]